MMGGRGKTSPIITYQQMTKAESVDWLNNYNWSKDVTQAEKDTVYAYQGNMFRVLNNLARGLLDDTYMNKDDRQYYQEQIKQLDDLIARSKIDRSITLYRGVKGDFNNVLRQKFQNNQLTPGTIMQDKGFLSTTASQAGVMNFLAEPNYKNTTVIRINTPKGTLAVNADGVSKRMMNEQEVILGRNTKLKIDKVEIGAKTGTLFIDVTVVK
jgi:hypothetical protein